MSKRQKIKYIRLLCNKGISIANNPNLWQGYLYYKDEQNHKSIYDIVVELRMLGVPIILPQVYSYNDKTIIYQEMLADIIRQIDEYLNFFKKIILIYIPIVVSIVSLLISIIK